MWVRQILMAILGLSAGVTIAGGIYSFVVSLGVVSDMASRTGTARWLRVYEKAVALGAILGNLMIIYRITLPLGLVWLGIYGGLSGIFVGAWSMALAETLNVLPIMSRRMKLARGVPWIILGIGLGKSVGAVFYFIRH